MLSVPKICRMIFQIDRHAYAGPWPTKEALRFCLPILDISETANHSS